MWLPYDAWVARKGAKGTKRKSYKCTGNKWSPPTRFARKGGPPGGLRPLPLKGAMRADWRSQICRILGLVPLSWNVAPMLRWLPAAATV